jgi:type I restriction enzyme S subunit
MGDDWQSVKLGDVVDLLTGFPFKSNHYTDDLLAPRLLRGDNVGQGVLRWAGAKRWPKHATKGLDEYWLREGDVILAMDRPWIEAGLKFGAIRESDLPALLVQRVARLRGTEQLDAKYLKYLIASSAFTDHVLAVETGTAVPHISGNQVKSFSLILPPLADQCAIGGYLAMLDDKIELNQRMNETLEAMARALFKSWFVDFDPVRAKAEGRDSGLPKPIADLFPTRLVDSEGDEIPDGWKIDILSS